jgi:hypothetical protein
MEKIIIAILLFILFLGLYIYLNHYVSENKEGFESNAFLDNTLKDSFNKSIEDIKKITPYNEINVDEIKELVKKELKIGGDYEIYDELHDLRENGQNDIIKGLEGNINALSKTSLFMGLDNDKLTNFRSIKSKQNSQPINLTPLSNSKYLININDKCLENNSLNHTSIKPCNLQNPNQYFSLNFINNDTDYRKYTIGDIFDLDPKENYKYPFTTVKSDSGNCLTNTDSFISVQPCNKLISQRWEASPKAVICGMKND